MRSFAASLLAGAALFASSVVADVDPIVIKGSKFFYKTNGTQFFIKGVAYQADFSNDTSASTTTYSDPLTDPVGCKRDIPLLQQLNTNTIRVYAINPDEDHSECMQMLQDAGIYVVSDLSQPSLSITSDDASWDIDLYTRYTSVVDTLANYTNVLGFFAGNEVSNSPNTTYASAFVKAAVRDTKAYIAAKGYRDIGVGYATADVSSIRTQLADYFNCGNQSAAIDFWGYNIYSWCGDSSYAASGYQDRTEEFSNYSVPAFFAEYGCNTQGTRTFEEANALYGSQMTQVFSGGIVYMYFQEANNYGLVSVSGSTASKMPDFSNLASRMSTLTPTGTSMSAYTPSNSAQSCPTTDNTWEAVATPLPPTPDQELCSCMYNSLSCVVNSSTDEDDYSKLFNQVCGYGKEYCAGINTNYTVGTYGAYGMCNSTQKLAYAFNAYYLGQSSSPSACSFGGSATTKSAASATGQCSALVAQVGTAGTGSVSSNPTATGSTGSSSGSSATSSGAAAGLSIPNFDFGLLNLGFYVFGAVFSGAAMVLL